MEEKMKFIILIILITLVWIPVFMPSESNLNIYDSNTVASSEDSGYANQ